MARNSTDSRNTFFRNQGSHYAATLDCDKMLIRMLTNSGRLRTLRNPTSLDVWATASLHVAEELLQFAPSFVGQVVGFTS